MKKIDIRFSNDAISILETFVSQELISIRHDPFMYGPSVYGLVGLFIGNNTYKLTNQVEVLDYFGKLEDVAVMHLEKAKNEQIVSFLEDVEMIDYPVHELIHEIKIINENQQLFYNGQQTYDIYTVRGIIFVLKSGREISFEKPIWFSEDIYVRKGHNLIETFTPVESFSEGWENCKGYKAKCTREIITLC